MSSAVAIPLANRFPPGAAILLVGLLGALVLSSPASAASQNPPRDPVADAGTGDTTSAPEAGSVVGDSGGTAEAGYQFAVARMLVEEGDYPGAREAFRRALELDPDASYVRVEYAEFLARLGRFGRTPEERVDRLREAVEEADRAVAELPGNVDALRAKATANMALAAEAPGDGGPMAAAIEALEGIREADPSAVRSMLSLGQIYLRNGRSDEAVAVFEAVIDTTPGYEPAYRFLAEALLDSGRRAEAADPLRKVLEEDPENESARLALAEILADRGDHREALHVLRGAPTGLESVEARTRLATELYLVGELEAAAARLEELAGDEPDSRYVRLLQGLVMSAQARNEEALATLEPLLDGGPGEADLVVTVSDLLHREEREDEAVEVLRESIERLESQGPQGEVPRLRLALARLYANLGRWETVEETVAPLLGDAGEGGQDDGLSVDFLLLWADALAEQGRSAEALERLRSAGGEEPAPALLSKRLELLAHQERLGEAVSILSSLAGSEDDPDVFLQAVEGLQRAGYYEETIAPLERFGEVHPGSVAGRFLLGAARERAGRRDEAAETFRSLLDDEPDFHPALNYLGYMWIEQGENLDEALRLVRQAVALDPDNGAYVDSLGWGLFQAGDSEESRETLERAARLTQDPTIYEHLGDVYAALGEAARARRAYRRAMELEADDPEAVARKLSELEASPNSGGVEPQPD